jgi:hypothetical protein
MTVTTAVAGLPRAVASWAERGRVPAGTLRATGVALAVCAAAWFTAPTRTAALAGGALLAAACLLARASGELAAGAGLGPASAEIAVYAGLAAGAPAAQQRTAWVLAVAAAVLLAARELVQDGRSRRPRSIGQARDVAATWAGRSGAALGGPCLLAAAIAPASGPVAALGAAAGGAVIMLGWRARQPAAAAATALVRASRDDGVAARRAGGLTGGRLVPLPPALAGLAATVLLAGAGMRGLPPVLLLAPAAALLLSAAGASHPHDGRWDWLVPPVLQAGECAYLAALGFARGVPAPLTLALVALIGLRRLRLCSGPGRPGGGPERAGAGWLGWDGRVLAAGLAAATGLAILAWLALAAYLGWALGRSVLAGQRAAGEGESR